MDNLICKMQAYKGVRRKYRIRIRRKKKRRVLKQFWGYRREFEGSCRKSGEEYQDDILKDDSP